MLRRLGFISGILTAVYVAAKSIDTLIWLNVTSPASRIRALGALRLQAIRARGSCSPRSCYSGCCPRRCCSIPRRAARRGWLFSRGRGWCAAAILLNRFVMTVQTLALPTLAFDEFLSYAAELAGDRQFRRRDRLRRHRLLPFLSIPAAVPAGERTRSLMFPGIDGFHWSFGHVLFLGLFFAIALTIAGTL